jgi:hypothetical protein
MSWAPKDASITLLDVAPNTPSTLGRKMKVDIRFVCTTHARVELAMIYKDMKDPINARDFLWWVIRQAQ